MHLELAESAKRLADVNRVREHVAAALHSQPKTPQVWIEGCRTLDELGELAMCRSLMELGLESCPQSEPLQLKLVRVLERLGQRTGLKRLAGIVAKEPQDRCWKVLLEAAHCEVRAGNGDAVSPILRCLLLKLPYQGPLYGEACRIEAMLGNLGPALSLAEQGVQMCLKYGPLWFVLLKLTEKVYGTAAVREYVALAKQHLCQELHWKLHFEVAAACSRDGHMQECRRHIARAALSCPRHLRWKVWLLAARAELWDGSEEMCRRLLDQARADAPARAQVSVWIELARAEEYLGCIDAARAALAEAQAYEGHEWKVFLENIFLEARQGCLSAAKETAFRALELHPSTGRLWSALITLDHCSDQAASAALQSFRKAVSEVPKSGEVWCEGARVYLNPVGPFFHLGQAQKCLEFAVHLTPQYGDSFLELQRLRVLLELRMRIRCDALAMGLLGSTAAAKLRPAGAIGARLAVATLVAKRVCLEVDSQLRSGTFSLRYESPVDTALCGQEEKEEASANGAPRVHLPLLEVFCSYADPNYGFLWFWCRESSLSSPREVLTRMHEEFLSDLVHGGALWPYVWAITCQVFGIRCPKQGSEDYTAAAAAAARPGLRGGEGLSKLLLAASSIQENHFALGLLRLAKALKPVVAPTLDDRSRRRLIFGSDILCS